MADRQIQIGLRFNADTSQAKAAIQELQTSLFKISSAGSMQGTKQELAQAATAAKELSYHLNQAYNANTGNLDLSKLDKSLKASGTNVTKLSNQLLQAGTTGQQAFVQLAQSIAAAERPMVTLSSRMSDLFTTIKNTAKWQISSSILHGFMGAVQTAYGYSKDLNESLNNIRIVTESNADQMAKFAEQANKAAKALSATTTEYTNASLIYFQQGLSEQQVKERTDVTIKIANVSGQSAETVSDQMTAVWNNFYDGSKSLEYYADVMTKLGAATASSSDEIAEGLEKFAAVSGTVGLSYEYATAALATVTAETRQSADVVGTAFKTMFARIQGLKLGETLEDGTTLNQYSQALMAVGVNIKDSNGELKKMDQILNEMANVWETLNRDEKAALAQKVAGIRQYNQLMSLMENWDVMEENLGFVSISEGSLQKQQEIYEESWKAASDRVRASMEAIYSDLIDDEFFIDLANGFSSLIDSLDAFIDGFGGVKMIVVSVASILMSTLAHKVPGALENLKANFNVVFKGAQHEAQKLSESMINTTNQALKEENFNLSDQIALRNSTNLLAIKNKISAVQSQLTDKEQQQYDLETQIIIKHQEELQTLAKKAMAEQENIDNLFEEMELIDSTSSIRAQREKEELSLVQAKRDAETALEQTAQGRTNAEKEAYATAKMNYDSATQALAKYRAETEIITGSQTDFTNVLLTSYTALMKNNNGIIATESEYVDVSDSLEDFTMKLEKLNTTLNNPKSKAGSSVGMTKSIQDIMSKIRNIRDEVKQITGDAMPELDKAFEKVSSSNSPEKLKTSMAQLVDTIKNAKIPTDQLGKILSKMGYETQVNKIDKEYRNLSKTTQDLTNKQKALNQRIKEFTPTHVVTGLERITQAAAGLGQVAMLATSVRSIFQAWNDDDLSFGEKLTTTFMSLSMIVPSVIGVLKSFNTVTSIGNQSLISSIITQRAYNASIKDGTTQIAMSTATKRLYYAEDKEGATIAVANMMARRGLITEEEKEAFVLALTTKLKNADNEETTESILQSTLLQFSKKGEVASYFATAAAQIKETAAKGHGIIAGGAHIAVLIGEQLAAWGLNAALAPLVGVFVVLALAIGAVVAIGYLVVKVFKDLKNSTPEAQLEAAKEKASELKTALDETATAAENLKTAFDDYNSLVEKLENCVRGTKEWRDALAEVNQAALKILEDNPELYSIPGAIERDENTGMIKITEEGQQYLQDKAYQRTLTASAELNMANQDVRNKEIEIIKKNIESQFTRSGNKTGMGEWSTFDSTTYDILKQVSNDFTSSDYNTTDIMKALNTEDSNDSRIQKILELKDEINNLSQSVKENTLATETETQAIASNILAGDEDFQKSSYADEISVNIGKVYDRIIEDSTNSYLEKISSDSEQAEIAVQKYISENGLSNLKGFTAEDPNDDGSFSYSYIDANNETQTKEVTADQIATTLATIDAMDGLINAANSLADIFSEIDSTERDAQGERYDEALKGFLSGDQDALFGLTQNDLSGVKNDFAKYIQTDEQAQKYGFEDLKEFNRIIDEEVDRVKEAWSGLEEFSEYTLEEAQGLNEAAENSKYKLEKVKEYYNNLSEEEKTLFLQIDFDENKTQQAWNEQLEELKEQQNSAIEQEYITKAEGLGIDTEEFKAYRDLLRETTNDYDDNVKGLNEVAIANKRLEKGVKSLAKDWEDFDEVMSDSNSSMEDVSAILPDINEGLIDVLNISKEDFELLPANFAQKNWSLIQDVMNNVDGAVDDLRDKASEEILLNITTDIDNEKIKAGITELHQFIQQKDIAEFTVGVAIDDTEFINNCNSLIAAAEMTAEEAQAYFAAMGYDVDIKEVPVEKTVTRTVEYPIIDERTGYPTGKTGTMELLEQTGTTGYAIETITPNGSYGGGVGVTTTAPKSMTKDKNKNSGGTKKDKLKTSDETERYHEVNEELDDLNRKLDQMGKKSDKAFGAQKIAYMNKELKLLNKTIDAQKEKLSEIEKNLSTDQATLNQYGAKYDKEGRITNYDEMVAAETAKYNQAIDSGNEKTIELAEKRYEDFKKSLEQYEETLNLLEEEEQNLQDYVDEKAELKLAKIQYTLEIGLELNEQDMKLIEYQLQKLENKAFSQAEKIVSYQQQTGILTNNAKLYENQATSILKSKGLNKKEREAVLNGDYSSLEGVEFTQEEISALQTSLNGLMETNKSLYETNELIRNQLPESFNEWNEKIDETLERFEYYKTLMGSFQDIVDILGVENLGLSKEFLRDMGWAQVAAANDEIESLTGHLQDLQTEEAKARDELSKATTEEDVEYWENIISDIEERENQIQSSILSNTTATLEQIKALYDQAIDDTFAEFEDKIAGSFKSLEELNEAYERAQKADEEYLADYKKLYELNKLNRDIEKSIDDTDSLKAKKALRELQAEIAEYEKDGVEMSQYDLEYMQKKYDLRLAEIALEEAQNAKSQVRLTRDASGNYSYTYTADQDQVDDATQKYNDALFAVQDLNETYIAEQASLIPQYMTEMVEKTREIENRADLTDEEKQEKIKETTDYYQGLIKTAGNNIEKGMGNNISLYQSEYEAFKAFNDGKQLAWDDFTTNFSQTTLSETLGPGFETLEGLYSNLATSIGSIDEPNSLLGKIKTHTDSYKTANDITLGLIGTSTENLAKTIATAILGENGDTTSISKSLGQGITDFGALATAAQTATGADDKTGIRGNITELAKSVFNAVYGKDGKSGIGKGLKDTKEQVNTLSTEASSDFTTLSTNVGAWQKTWNDEISKVIAKNEALMNGYNDLIKSLAQTYKDPENTTTNRVITENVIITKYETQGDGSENTPGGNGPEAGKLDKGDKVWAKTGDDEWIAAYSSAEDKKSKMSWHITKEKPHTVKDFKTSSIGHGSTMVKLEDTNGRTYWAKLSDLTGFDTGGYTGAWGTQGKLAMLHEKELVLNKEDTSNILNVVSMVRELAKSIDLNAQQTSYGLGLLRVATAANSTQQLEQDVTIHAEFPGVRDRHEIEEAFTSLVNRATQFANRY